VTARLFLRQLWRDEAGATMLEFALLSPLLIFLLVGTLQVGIMLQS